MALQKQMNWKGYSVEYWMIGNFNPNKVENKTLCTVFGYKDKATRDLNIKNYIPELTKEGVFDGQLTVDDLYVEIKKPIMQTFQVGLDELNIPITEERNVNWFTDSVNV